MTQKKRKLQSISPIPYAFLCSVLDSVNFRRQIKRIDTTHFMVASYFVVGSSGSRILKTHAEILLYPSPAMPVI
jgi:hypothetical protein